MFLKRIAITNYRSCRSLVLEFALAKPSIYIGTNDSGKSTILRAIGLLLDGKTPFNSSKDGQVTSDVSNTSVSEESYNQIFQRFGLPTFPYSPTQTVLIGEFEIQEGDISEEFRSESSNQLQWSIESNGNKISLLKSFSNANPAGLYYLCSADTNPPKEVWKQTQANLKKLVSDLSISDEEIENENAVGRFKNIEKARAVYRRTPTSLQWAPYAEFLKGDGPFFPKYRYVDWNASLDEINAIAKDVTSSLIQTLKDELSTHAKAVSETATRQINSALSERMRDLLDDIPSIQAIKTRVRFDIQEKLVDTMVNKVGGDGDIRIESQGEGVKKQIWLALLRLGSLQGISPDEQRKKFIWCFDEPEVHLYPSAQRELFGIINSLATKVYQIIVSTHSTIFTDRIGMKEIKQAHLSNAYTEIVSCNCVDDVYESLGAKNSDFLFFNQFFVCEGSVEEILVPHFYKLFYKKTLQEAGIQAVGLGGESNWQANKLIFENIMRDFRKPTEMAYYFLDRDTNLNADNVCLSGVLDIEDSISDEIWIAVIQESCGVILNAADMERLRAQLTNDADHKLHKLLGDRVARTPGKTGFLPSKVECAKLLVKRIDAAAKIPACIQEFFRMKFGSPI